MDLLIVIVVWIIFGIIAGVIWHNNGRSGNGGFWLGILLGPLGIILVLVMGSGLACPECRGSVVRGASRCS